MSQFSFRLKCPYCRSDSTFQISSIFTPAAQQEDAKYYSVSAICGHYTCYGPVALRTVAIDHDRMWQAANILRYNNIPYAPHTQDISPYFRILEQWPPEPAPDIPDFLSDKVANVFQQAEETRFGKQNLLSAIGYRSALDLATKDVSPLPDSTKIEMLGARLGRLSKEGHLTQSLGEWAEHIGFLGNASTHDGDQLTNSELDELAMLTKMTLIYLFTLPETIKRLRGTPTIGHSDIDPESLAARFKRWIGFKPRLTKLGKSSS
ncbi:DUF4145 domain-containing protein [Acetobacter lambici]|uniref:DUF4145 domain-containing protein n=1 Tax=Acetobacter lambici TaxID=1332824 RepID=A0ABT1EZF9_9PROT|nr:DUF4145 domain-containing protein [Acetobacter lambici]MCP1243261.1 DUF4145 domain-containing protein [Acetobacter lambici]MCP1258334.1 DUF4145 domain-containing protein [Acetobacter lambici]